MQNNQYQRKYKQLSLLGQGSYGKVYKVQLNEEGGSKEHQYFVAKKMNLEGLSEQEINSALGEIRILEKLNKQISSSEIPFLVTYRQFFRIETELIIIMECCECGELTTLLKSLKKNKQRLNEKIIAFWFIQLLFGVQALHNKKILHRDLKSANVFLTKQFSLKIGDFGISKVLEGSSAITCIGTPMYLSPEVCNNKPYGRSSDVWALGCILYEMCTLRYPFEGSNLIILASKIISEEVSPLPSYYSEQLNEIVMKMFVKDKEKRITIDQLLQTKYLQSAMADFVNEQERLQQLANPISIEEVESGADYEQAEGNEAQDTMKTINSVVEKTGPNPALNSSKMELKKQETILALKSAKLQTISPQSSQKNRRKSKQLNTISGMICQPNQMQKTGQINCLKVHEEEVFENVPLKSTAKIGKSNKIIQQSVAKGEEYADDFEDYKEEDNEKTRKQERIIAYFKKELAAQTLVPKRKIES